MKPIAANKLNICLSIFVLGVFAAIATAKRDEPPTTTVEGLVRDIACPIQNTDATATTFNVHCAQECARQGSPLIILDRKGFIYVPISASIPDTDQRPRLLPFVGKFVKVSGKVYERNGTHAIAIADIVEMKRVPLVTDGQ